jgi:hypothetical protein
MPQYFTGDRRGGSKLRRAVSVAALLVLFGCSADTTTTTTTAPVTGLSLNAVTLAAGDSVAPTIRVTAGDETRAATPSEIIVTSSDTSVVVIAANDALIAVGDGQADITIAWAATPSISVTRTVTITSEILSGVTLLAPLTMVPGDSTALAVTGKIRDGRTIVHPTSVTVASRNPAIVAVVSGNLAIASAPGQAWIVATAATGVADSALVTVAVGAPAHLVVTPESASLVAGQTTHVTVVSMSDRRGNAIANVTPTFATSAPGIATVQSDGTVTGVAAGSAMIVATAGSAADTLRLAVSPLPPTFQSLTVTPDSITLHPGDTTHVVVKAFDNQGNQIALPALTWSSLTTGITVSSGGLITAASTITSTIPNGAVRVSSGAVMAQLRVAVVYVPPPPFLQQLIATPDSVTLSPGGTAQISVQALDNHGAAMALPNLTWTSLTGGITVSSTGLIAASSSIGSTISNGVVQLSGGGITTQVRVAVVVVVAVAPPPASDNGYMQIQWIGTLPSAAIVAAFEAQRVRVNGLFKSFNGVAPVPLTIPANYCIAGAPAVNDTVPGILLYVQVGPIDGVGNILGSAGPCLLRTTTWLPVVGTMQLDVADMNSMVANGTLGGVVLHEMMHTLGFGTIWFPGEQSEVPLPNGSDPRYLGPTGMAEYSALGASDAASGVPVENTGGSGTRGSHWRESVFHTELMTGWADGAMQMSRVTVGALKDFGYDVDLTKADPFTLSASLVGAALRASVMIGEQNIAPIGVIGKTGKITPYTGGVAH